MELSEVVNTQYAFPVGIVLICAVLVFVFGFKSAEQPAFAQLTYTGDDRKPAGKKRKIKEKKTQSNGHVASVNDDSEIKQKGSESYSSKPNASKVVTKQGKEGKQDSEKSPSKDNLNKAVTKQQKPNKQETSPSKEQQSKMAIKEPVTKSTAAKLQKDNKKETSEPVTKQLKEKKQESVEKSPSKDSNKNVPAKQTKNKGKENQVEEIKNKKNEKNLAKLKKNDEKPVDFDDGQWEQALSRKDKKNRKKDDPFANEDAVSENIVKKETASPAKKKKSKNVDAGNTDAAPAEEPKIIENKNQKTPEKKPSNKEKKDKITEKETMPVVEVIVAPESKANDESGSAQESAAKSKKKNKKKGNKSAETEATVVSETTKTVEVAPAPPVVEIKVTEKKQAEVKEEAKIKAEITPKNEPDNAVAFDELGDIWKDAKQQKKTKKKVRKDQ